ncbi:MAG: hypothetical protein Q7T41_04425 [Candidatus Saccharibacteria bacterium]|nr:hypothetical protein [Candidatus Saccharibacteria bacterium]
MRKRKNHRSDKKSVYKIVVFGGATVATGALSVVGLINNGNGAVKRFEALKAVDSAGGDVDTALNELRSYIYAHMNTEIGGPNGIYPPIQLRGTYERLVATEEKRVADTNDNLIVEAKEYCEANGSQGFSGRYRIDCVGAYTDEYGAKIQEIDSSLYKYDFVAPRWSPDLAGFSIVATILFSLITIFQILSYFRTKHIINIAN